MINSELTLSIAVALSIVEIVKYLIFVYARSLTRVDMDSMVEILEKMHEEESNKESKN